MRWLALLLLVTIVAPASAQTTGERVYRLGVLALPGPSLASIQSETLPELARLGFAEGRNLVVDARTGDAPALPGLVRELLLARPDAIIASSSFATEAARQATTTVPIIGFGFEALGQGSLARPTGNVTGVVILTAELDGKRLELLHEALPGVGRVAMLLFTGSSTRQAVEREMRAVAARIRIELLTFPVGGPEHYPSAFAAMRAAEAQALLIPAGPIFYRDGGRLAELAAANGLPTACEWAEMARSGCLLGYGPNLGQVRRRLAHYAAGTFRGAMPRDLPVETPTHFEFAVNMRVARALGITVPPSILIRADEVIE